MTKLLELEKIIKESNTEALLNWLEEYALWFDPAGWWDEEETIKYLFSEKDKGGSD